MSGTQHFDINLLVLEDDESMQEAMKRGLEKVKSELQKKKLRILPRWITHSGVLPSELQSRLFHFASLDLRVPNVPNGILLSEQDGLKHFLSHRKIAPLTHVALMTMYAPDYLGAIEKAGRHHYELWRKAINENESDTKIMPPVLTFDQWAERVLKQLEDYGRAQAFAWGAAKAMLPGYLRSCARELELCCENPWTDPARDAKAARTHRVRSHHGLEYAFDLAEQVQNWLWVILCAYLAARAPSRLPDSVARVLRSAPGDERPVEERRSDKEMQLGELCAQVLGLAKSMGEEPPLLLTQLGCSEKEHGATRFINALRLMRERRNTLTHEAKEGSYGSMWDDIALSLRWMLNVVAYLCAYPIVTELEALGSGNFRARRLGVDRSSSSSEEWSVSHGVLRATGTDDVDASPDYEQAYALWPVQHGQLALVPLWPLIELRYNSDTKARETFLYLMRDAHKRPRDLNIDTLKWVTQTDGSEREEAFARMIEQAQQS